MKKLVPILFIVGFIISSCQRSSGELLTAPTIGEIQSCSHISPYNGKKVIGVEGVVTHKFKNGFTMQSIVNDSLPCSSEAIFVTTGIYPSVFPGQLVSVDGKINEYSPGTEEDHNLSRTELHDPSIVVIEENVALPQPINLRKVSSIAPLNWIKDGNDFDIQKNGLDYYESLEFMLVEIDSGIVVGPKNSYNEFYVLPEEYRTDNILSVQGVLLLKSDDENPEKLMIDAASSFTKEVNVGDTFTNPIVGIMDYSFGNFKIWTIKDPVIQTTEIAHSIIKLNSESLTIASYNIENFSRFDDNSRIHKLGCQIAKDLQSPDIIVLHEVLDDSGVQDDKEISSNQTLQLLTEAISSCGGPLYAYSDNPPINNRDGGIQGGNIRTAVIFRKDRGVVLDIPDKEVNGLSFRGGLLKIDQNPMRLFSYENDFSGTRKPSLWLFTWKGEQYLVLGLHLVSQSATSPSWGNIQPPENPEQEKRISQMKLMTEFVNDILSQDANMNLIVLGDINDYPWSETLNLLNSSPVTILTDEQNVNENFSYIHEGNAFQFDYAAVSNNLLNQITNYSILHLNTIFNINSQISDHDPILFQISQQ